MLRLSWHIGDVIRKVRTVHDLTQGQVYGRVSTGSSVERGGNFEQKSVIKAAELLSKALLERKVIDAPLTVEDLNALVPVPRNDVPRPPLDPEAVDVALMFQRLSVGGKATARTVMQALSLTQADPHAGGLPHAGGATGTTQR